MIGIGVTWLISLVCLLIRIIASFRSYTSYLKITFFKGPIANSSSCTTSGLSILLTSYHTAIKNHIIKYCETVYERNGKSIFWSIKIQVRLKFKGFLASGLSTHDFSTLYTRLPHILIRIN